jgi:hypothetical protein
VISFSDNKISGACSIVTHVVIGKSIITYNFIQHTAEVLKIKISKQRERGKRERQEYEGIMKRNKMSQE